MVVPGASKSMSGVKRYVDFIGCLPVDLSSRILGGAFVFLKTHLLCTDKDFILLYYDTVFEMNIHYIVIISCLITKSAVLIIA